jgi:hypothetical protein
MAMAEASKLFDSSGGASSGNKQDAINGAAMTVMKLMVQSKFSGGGTSGGMGSLLGLVSDPSSSKYRLLKFDSSYRHRSTCNLISAC